ncbi:MAG: hypothetical protein ABIC57_03280 [bacterium]
MAPETPVPQPTDVTPASDTATPGPASAPEATPTPEAQPEPAPEPAAAPKPVEEKGKMRWIYIALIFIGLIALALVGYIAYTEIFMEDAQEVSDDSGEDMDEQETDTDLDVEEEATETFTGDAVTAELPEGWSIVEYFDGAGTDMTVTGVTYVGLTGLEIINPDDDVVFSIKAVDGIGGVDSCETYAQFPDYNVTHYNEDVTLSAEIGVTTSPVTYTADDYTEFDFLGLSVRRVEDYLYIDEVAGNSYFEPPCGLLASAWQISDISYTTEGVESHAYIWEVDDEATDAELLQLDAILASIEAV